MTSLAPPRAALRLTVSGLAQGVGFRPFVYRLAQRHDLTGWVRNRSGTVEILVEGDPASLDEFVRCLRGEAPPRAAVEEIVVERAEPAGLSRFEIAPSQGGDESPVVGPDSGICAACEAELFDPADRRYRYPFITCTECGPRFTVIEAMPYDRERTSLRAFPLCAACRAEYMVPGNRRFHAESICCPTCGPTLAFVAGDGEPEVGNAGAIARTAGALRAGRIVAVRGLGGFHLAVDGRNEAAVRRLRQRKGREAKPFAVMVRTLDEARALAWITPEEAELLMAPERPIVLVRRHEGADLAPSVAPGLDRIGVMLAYTPLHHLVLEAAGSPLVMTSGNQSEEPIAIGNAEAQIRLAGIADAFLLHDREIVARYDDSVARVTDQGVLWLRRARGCSPRPLALPVATPVPLLAVGPHLKNTLTLARHTTAYVSQHIGDLDGLEALAHFQATREHLGRLFQIVPEAVAYDLHPGYLSTRIAMEIPDVARIGVQHHHAHLAAVAAEHGIAGPVIGVVLDGTGYGTDGTIWGGEILVGDLVDFRRAAHLRAIPLPGGDLAARTPWRSALGYRALVDGAGEAVLFDSALAGIPPEEIAIAERQLDTRVNVAWCSSAGRLFDAVAALLGICRVSRYEAQAPMVLETAAGRRPAGEYRCGLAETDTGWVIDPLPLLGQLAWRLRRGADVRDLAADFHASLAWAITGAVVRVAEREGTCTVVLGGGVFQNARLLAGVTSRLEARHLTVLRPERLGPNDGAVSFGQAAIAAARLAAGHSIV